MGQILSQSEVEAILSAVNVQSHVRVPATSPSFSSFAPSVSLYDFEHPEPLKQSQLDTLHRLAIANRDGLELSLKKLLRSPVQVAFLAVEQSTFRDYLSTSEQPGCLVVLGSLSSSTNWLLDVGRLLALKSIDCMLGGQADADPHGVDAARPFTEVEVNLLQKAFAAVSLELTRGLAPDACFRPKQVISDIAMLVESTSNDAVALVSYEIVCGGHQGLLQLCVPWKCAAEASAKDLSAKRLNRPFDASQPLRAGAGQLPVRVTARMNEFKLPAIDLASLQRGDVIMTDVSSREEFRLEISGIEVFRGTPGQDQNRKAIVLSTPIHHPPATRETETIPSERQNP